MRITVYNQEIELLVQTISVETSLTNPENAYLLFCPYCSHQIVQIQGVVSRIVPGLEPTSGVVVINKCLRCEMRYAIQNQTTHTSNTKVILSRWGNKESVFRCYICRTPQLSFADDIILLPSMKRAVLPVDVRCPNTRCPGSYSIVDVI